MRILRTYARAYAADLDAAAEPLSQATGQPITSRFALPNGLELATVGRVLIVAGDDDALAPYRRTRATLIVDDLDACIALVAAAGGSVLRGPQQVPTGRNLTARLPGGTQLEYVEWDDAQWRRAGGRPA
jgi:hypothetical protein